MMEQKNNQKEDLTRSVWFKPFQLLLPDYAKYGLRSYYKASEILEILNLKSYILRFWESEFECLVPMKGDGGQNLYSLTDMKILFRLKELLLEKEFPIEKAKMILNQEYQVYRYSSSHEDLGIIDLKEKLEQKKSKIQEAVIVEAPMFSADSFSLNDGGNDDLARELSGDLFANMAEETFSFQRENSSRLEDDSAVVIPAELDRLPVEIFQNEILKNCNKKFEDSSLQMIELIQVLETEYQQRIIKWSLNLKQELSDLKKILL